MHVCSECDFCIHASSVSTRTAYSTALVYIHQRELEIVLNIQSQYEQRGIQTVHYSYVLAHKQALTVKQAVTATTSL
jgi:hypothetical protein